MHKFLEKFWLVIAVVGTIATIIFTIQDGFDKTMSVWLIVGFAWGMYFMRRGVRKRLEKFGGQKKK